jgi:hypothetical protein
VIHLLIVAAIILFVLWLLFHAAAGLVNLLWIAIIVLAIIWLVGLVRTRRTQMA